MNDWRKFDMVAFLKASRGWDSRIEALKKEYDSLISLPSLNNKTGVRTGNKTDITANTALRRAEISSEIEELLLYKEMLAHAYKTLSEDEKRLIDGFYKPKKSIGAFVQEYGSENGLCANYVYAKRNRIQNKMGQAIEQKYY